MNSTTYRFSNRPRMTTALLLVASVLGMLAACSSDGNPRPKNPIINTGGAEDTGPGGNGGRNQNNTGGTSASGSRAGGSNNRAGSDNADDAGAGGVSGATNDDGSAGEAGAGPGPVIPDCPTTDLGFLNQPSNSQKAPFDNTKRLGAHATLPPLP